MAGGTPPDFSFNFALAWMACSWILSSLDNVFDSGSYARSKMGSPPPTRMASMISFDISRYRCRSSSSAEVMRGSALLCGLGVFLLFRNFSIDLPDLPALANPWRSRRCATRVLRWTTSAWVTGRDRCTTNGFAL